ncbi:MAG: hypothetical protein AC479_07620 [miscellaneous Crenarchaeota group-6 archaeon AD8-1]|nr:MAG: hypothetical protein AC479_07620 [miscellaneous Crenarchaeota group-6 archaeon AD8-1]
MTNIVAFLLADVQVIVIANQKILDAVSFFIVIFILIGAFLFSSFINYNTNQEKLNFSITSSNECLRFLSRTIETACYSEDLYSILANVVILDFKLGLENP